MRRHQWSLREREREGDRFQIPKKKLQLGFDGAFAGRAYGQRWITADPSRRGVQCTTVRVSENWEFDSSILFGFLLQ